MTRNEFIAKAALQICRSYLSEEKDYGEIIEIACEFANALEEKGVAPWKDIPNPYEKQQQTLK